jgi:hypothetical protein
VTSYTQRNFRRKTGGARAPSERELIRLLRMESTHAQSGTRCATDESTCTPGPVPPEGGGGHPSRPTVAGRLQRPTRRHRAGNPQPPAQAPPRGEALLALLRVGFTEPSRSPGMLVGSYPTVSPLPRPTTTRRGGLLSVALSRGSPRVAVSNHPALWSPDVPRQSLRP